MVPDGAGPASRGEALLGKVAGCCSGKCPKKGDISLGGLERQFLLYGSLWPYILRVLDCFGPYMASFFFMFAVPRSI